MLSCEAGAALLKKKATCRPMATSHPEMTAGAAAKWDLADTRKWRSRLKLSRPGPISIPMMKEAPRAGKTRVGRVIAQGDAEQADPLGDDTLGDKMAGGTRNGSACHDTNRNNTVASDVGDSETVLKVTAQGHEQRGELRTSMNRQAPNYGRETDAGGTQSRSAWKGADAAGPAHTMQNRGIPRPQKQKLIALGDEVRKRVSAHQAENARRHDEKDGTHRWSAFWNPYGQDTVPVASKKEMMEQPWPKDLAQGDAENRILRANPNNDEGEKEMMIKTGGTLHRSARQSEVTDTYAGATKSEKTPMQGRSTYTAQSDGSRQNLIAIPAYSVRRVDDEDRTYLRSAFKSLDVKNKIPEADSDEMPERTWPSTTAQGDESNRDYDTASEEEIRKEGGTYNRSADRSGGSIGRAKAVPDDGRAGQKRSTVSTLGDGVGKTPTAIPTYNRRREENESGTHARSALTNLNEKHTASKYGIDKVATHPRQGSHSQGDTEDGKVEPYRHDEPLADKEAAKAGRIQNGSASRDKDKGERKATAPWLMGPVWCRKAAEEIRVSAKAYIQLDRQAMTAEGNLKCICGLQTCLCGLATETWPDQTSLKNATRQDSKNGERDAHTEKDPTQLHNGEILSGPGGARYRPAEQNVIKGKGTSDGTTDITDKEAVEKGLDVGGVSRRPVHVDMSKVSNTNENMDERPNADRWAGAVESLRKRIEKVADTTVQQQSRNLVARKSDKETRGKHPTRRAWEPGIGLGKSKATAANVTKFNELLTTCGDPECTALVQVNALIRVARKADRQGGAVSMDDACTARKHQVRFDASNFVRRQLYRIEAVLDASEDGSSPGEWTTIIERPSTTLQNEWREMPNKEMAAHLNAALDGALHELPQARSLLKHAELSKDIAQRTMPPTYKHVENDESAARTGGIARSACQPNNTNVEKNIVTEGVKACVRGTERSTHAVPSYKDPAEMVESPLEWSSDDDFEAIPPPIKRRPVSPPPSPPPDPASMKDDRKNWWILKIWVLLSQCFPAHVTAVLMEQVPKEWLPYQLREMMGQIYDKNITTGPKQPPECPPPSPPPSPRGDDGKRHVWVEAGQYLFNRVAESAQLRRNACCPISKAGLIRMEISMLNGLSGLSPRVVGVTPPHLNQTGG